jgi:hypothetical protein
MLEHSSFILHFPNTPIKVLKYVNTSYVFELKMPSEKTKL